MARVFRPIGHEDRLTIVDHLGELRSRLIVCALAVAVAFGLCFWQNQRLLHLLNRPLPATFQSGSGHLGGLAHDTAKAARSLAAVAADVRQLASSRTQSSHDRALFLAMANNLERTARALPQTAPKQLPITIGVGEPFTTTLTVAFYFALLLSLPLLLYEAYAFLVPALTRTERRVALPLMVTAPALFIVGVVFCYLVVLTPAIHFLQGYNSQNFQNLVQAKQLYDFEILVMAGIGLAFQLPLALLALDYMGVINARTLTKHWRYAVILIAVIAAALPGPDPVTTALEMAPLVVLYLLSIVLLKLADRRIARSQSELNTLDATG